MRTDWRLTLYRLAEASVTECLAAIALGFLVVSLVGCDWVGSGPSDQDVVSVVRKSPPAPPTAGPTYLAEVESVEVQERGRYSAEGRYWPVRIRVKGGIRLKGTNVFQLGLLADAAQQPPKRVDFVEETRFRKNDFGHWRISYNYDLHGPRWRLDGPETSSPRQP